MTAPLRLLDADRKALEPTPMRIAAMARSECPKEDSAAGYNPKRWSRQLVFAVDGCQLGDQRAVNRSWAIANSAAAVTARP